MFLLFFRITVYTLDISIHISLLHLYLDRPIP